MENIIPKKESSVTAFLNLNSIYMYIIYKTYK